MLTKENYIFYMIMTGQMTREKALEDLGKIPYRSELDLKEDKDYF